MITEVGDRVSSVLNLGTTTRSALARVRPGLSVSEFRLRQATTASLAVVVLGAAGGTLSGPGLGGLASLAALGLAFVGPEVGLALRSQRYQAQVRAELPNLAERLATLLSAGWSTQAALSRLADGRRSDDVARVMALVEAGHGLDRALADWAGRAEVSGLSHLVGVLALERDAPDLARLVADEARTLARARHRELVEVANRRAQQVWIPVTVAALVPGALLIAIPFLHTIRTLGA